MTALVDQPVVAQTAAPARTGRWPRGALTGLLVATGVLYLWNLLHEPMPPPADSPAASISRLVSG